ncbi:uncharacterized protein LOC136032659 [Artemia franciscana]|uniref:uncharacterized protein LOC136032659 n=1 Tax=Artemia franciscana TaxID=6661 RepID=UPI0032D9C61A
MAYSGLSCIYVFLLSALFIHPVQLVKCSKTSLDDCLSPLYPLMEDPLVKGIPQSKIAVEKSCTAFKKGMTCVDAATECMTKRQRQSLQKQVEGARNTFAFLCDDADFQRDFLQHQSCYRAISNYWQKCANRFQDFITEDQEHMELTAEEHEIGQCCAKMGFLNCVYDKVRFLCRTDSNLFVMKVAQTLANFQVHSDSCVNITEATCTSTYPLPSLLVLILLAYLLIKI